MGLFREKGVYFSNMKFILFNEISCLIKPCLFCYSSYLLMQFLAKFGERKTLEINIQKFESFFCKKFSNLCMKKMLLKRCMKKITLSSSTIMIKFIFSIISIMPKYIYQHYCKFE